MIVYLESFFFFFINKRIVCVGVDVSVEFESKFCFSVCYGSFVNFIVTFFGCIGVYL